MCICNYLRVFPINLMHQASLNCQVTSLQTSIKLVCNVLSLPIPSDCANVSADEVNTQNSVEEKMPSKLVLVGYHKSGTSTIFKQVRHWWRELHDYTSLSRVKFVT